MALQTSESVYCVQIHYLVLGCVGPNSGQFGFCSRQGGQHLTASAGQHSRQRQIQLHSEPQSISRTLNKQGAVAGSMHPLLPFQSHALLFSRCIASSGTQRKTACIRHARPPWYSCLSSSSETSGRYLGKGRLAPRGSAWRVCLG